MALRQLAQRRRRPKQQTTVAAPFPAPVAGLVAYRGIYNNTGGGEAAIWLYNMIPSEYGCRVRKGSREVAINLPDSQSSTGEVRTVAFYNSVVAESSGGQDFLFAMTDLGIYDITTQQDAPWIAALDWPSPGGNAGWTQTLNYTNLGGDHFLLIFDEANGYYIMENQGGTPTFRRPTGFQPADAQPEDLVQGVEWQGRMWFVERDSANMWYTNTAGGIEGNISAVNLGSRFLKGGHLVQLAVWTVDDGAGMDDKLVCISSAGDVIIWSLGGNFNPDNADDFRVEGRWSVGKVPEGRRVMSQFGGDVHILSSYGVLKLTALLGGAASINDESFITNKIVRYVRAYMQERVDQYGWQIELDPADSIMLITVPYNINSIDRDYVQFVLNISSGSWCMFRDLQMVCMNKSNLGLLFGTNDGRVMAHEGTSDNVSIDAESPTADTIKYSVLTHYTHLGQPSTWKRGQIIRPIFIGNSLPIYGVKARYDFDLSEVGTNPPYLASDISRWDEAIWNEDKWGGTAQGYITTQGLSGMGRHIAIAMRGETTDELSLVGWDVMIETGGML